MKAGQAATLAATVRDLRKLLATLDRFAGHGRPIDEAILDALTDAELTTSALATLIRRRRGDVLTTLRLLHAAGRVQRTADQKRWCVDA